MNRGLVNDKIVKVGSFRHLIPDYINDKNVKIKFEIINNYNIHVSFYYSSIFPLYIHNLPHDIVRHILPYCKEYIIVKLNIELDNNFPYHQPYIHIIKVEGNKELRKEKQLMKEKVKNHNIEKHTPIYCLHNNIVELFLTLI